MRYVSVFSGVEAATLAWEALGWEPICFCEIDDFPSAVLKARWPHVPNLGDITKVDWKEVKRAYGAADLVVGGSPCQSFSIAGDRTGLDGASGLMWEYVRAIRGLMPRWLFWENVPGALSSSHGEDFGCLLRELDALGYGLAWRVLDAQFFGVPQRRERLFVVGSLGEGGAQRACEVLFEPESLPWDLATSREKRKELAARAGIGAEGAGGAMNPADPQSKRVFSTDGPAPTINSGTGEGMNIQPSVMVDLTQGECQSKRIYSAGGVSPALRSQEAGGADSVKVLCVADAQSNSMVSDEICGTVTAHASRGGGSVHSEDRQ